MKQFYKEKTANYPRLETDKLFADYDNTFSFSGIIDKSIRYIEDFQLLDATLWKRFVDQFREEDADSDSGWRCEYWGKMMRGAALTYSYTKNEELYTLLTDTVKDMMSAREESGRISTYAVSHELDAWDMWGRKYILLGMQYYLEICVDEALKQDIIASMCEQVDYIMERIGEGKKPITSATHHWRGLNACSILEPIVRLYTLTGEKKYFTFAEYIVGIGGTDCANVFELAYEDQFYPYQYPVTKAYEMTSCFEGLLEFYRLTKIEKYKIALVNYAKKILEADFTIIGSSGCTHELFDHSTVRQANTTNGDIVQETCVTVTLMKFFYQLCLLTGESYFVDAFETSMYNAFLGSINTNKICSRPIDAPSDYIDQPLPFDSYSPLVAGTRGNGVGGFKIMSDKTYYGCCACIGSAATGLIPKMALLSSKNGFAFNLYIDGEIKTYSPSESEVRFITQTSYPADGKIKITVKLDKAEEFEIKLRIPKWSHSTSLIVNNEAFEIQTGYTPLNRVWNDGDEIILWLDMRAEAVYPIPYGHEILMNKVIWGVNYMVSTYDIEDPEAKNHISLRRGPLVLAQENRLGYSVDDAVSISVREDGYVDAVIPNDKKAPYENIVEVAVPLKNGTYMHLTDYSSAGKLWNEETKLAAWIKTKK